MVRTFTCILCPNGCEISAEYEGKTLISCTGHKCDNGKKYVEQELCDPRRTIASSVLVIGGERPLVSVRLTQPIPRDLIFPLMDKIHTISVTAPVKAGTVLMENVFGTGSDLITTSNVNQK